MDTLFFDEAGGTGSDLLHPDQPHFAYAGVQVEDAEASQVIEAIRADHPSQAPEFKASWILKRRDAAQIVRRVAEACEGRAFLFVADKKVALSGKLFDYTVEPVLFEADVRDPFFEMGAHTYFLNHFYWIWQLGDDDVRAAADRVAREFQELARARQTGAPLLFGGGPSGTGNGFLDSYLSFCARHEDSIRAELDDVADDGVLGKWVLELTVAALHVILDKSGVEGPLRVVCDESHPVWSHLPLLQNGVATPAGLDVTYEAAPSRDHAGIQLADVLASSAAYALKDPTARHAAELLDVLSPFLVWSIGFDEGAVAPGPGMAACEALFLSSARGETPVEALSRALRVPRR